MSKTRVLVIDDAVVVRRIVTDVLASDPTLEVAGTAANGKIGLAKIPQVNPDVITLDIEMPEMDGLTVLKEIRAMDPRAPVIVLGGGATEVQENQARGLRATDFIRKGLSLDVLVEAVQRVSQVPARPNPVSVAVDSSHTVKPTNESVLVIDDDPLVCDLLVQFLSLRGYRALGVNDGQDALRMAEDVLPDAILLDLVMPGMSGLDVLRAFREKEFSGGVIIMSGSHNDELLEEAWALGPQEVLVKPIDLEHLLTVIQLVLVCREC